MEKESYRRKGGGGAAIFAFEADVKLNQVAMNEGYGKKERMPEEKKERGRIDGHDPILSVLVASV